MMSHPSYDTVVQAFDKAASSYEAQALLQKEVAKDLTSFLTENPSPSSIQSILELGCGTGLLTEEILREVSPQLYIGTDLSGAMLKQAQKRCQRLKKSPLSVSSELIFGLLDANTPDLSTVSLGNNQSGSVPLDVDWSISSLVFQWLENLENTLSCLWSQTNKRLAFTTLLEGSLTEWDQLCHKHNLPSKTLPFLSFEKLQEALSLPHAHVCVKKKEYSFCFPSPLAFVQSLKHIGAQTSASSSHNKAAFYHLLRTKQPLTVTYQVAFCCLDKENSDKKL